MGSPNISPSSIRSWPVQYDLIYAHTRRGTNIYQTLVARISLRNLRVCATLKNVSLKPCGTKGHGEKSTNTTLVYTSVNSRGFQTPSALMFIFSIPSSSGFVSFGRFYDMASRLRSARMSPMLGTWRYQLGPSYSGSCCTCISDGVMRL